MSVDREIPSIRVDERGVALPLALFGLVAVSLLVTTALLTSSTELALSRAHQDGARGLYAADAALEQFVAQRAAMATDTDLRFAPGVFSVTPTGGAPHRISVGRLFQSVPVGIAGDSLQRWETYSLVAEPQNGRGRGVGGLIEAIRTAGPVDLNVDSGLTLWINTIVSGNATISDGSSPGAACDSTAAGSAIRHASGTTLTRQGSANDVIGSVVEDTRNASQLMSYVLDGRNVNELAAMAHIKFGPRFNKPAFSGSPSQTDPDVSYRWGCPAQLVTGCTPAQAQYFPTVAIDANGGIVDLTGHHAQGIIVVVNGGLHIRGNFLFGGIVVVEGALRVTGTPRIEGAVIAMGDEAVIEPGDTSEMSNGNSLIRFNQCQITNALQSLTLQSLDTTPQRIASRTFAWFEVVR